jgi:hypothetical protein
MTDWTPRFVGPNFVVNQEDVRRIDLVDGTFDYFDADRNRQWARISEFRPDRPTGQTDQNGETIFENDRVTDEWGAVWTVCMDDGAWCVCDENDGQCEILDTIGASIVTITDMVSHVEKP